MYFIGLQKLLFILLRYSLCNYFVHVYEYVHFIILYIYIYIYKYTFICVIFVYVSMCTFVFRNYIDTSFTK